MNNLFNVDVTAPVTEIDEQAAKEFRPNYKKGVGGKFEAYIRFLPNPKDPASGSIIRKYSAQVKNYATNQERWIDCPSTVGQPDVIQDTFFLLRKGTPAQQTASKSFSRKARFASLVQVLVCQSKPELVGQVLVWNYGQKVYNKIQAEMNPENQMITARNPFNMLNGRPFWVKCKEVSGFNNFDDSSFFDAQQMTVMIPFNGNPTPVTMENIQNPAFAEAVNTWLNESAPSLEPYMYHDWDDETKRFVMDAINAATSPNLVITDNTAPQQAATPHATYGASFGAPQQASQVPNMGGFSGGMQMNMPGMGMSTSVPGGMPGGMQMPGGFGMPQQPTVPQQPVAPQQPQTPNMGGMNFGMPQQPAASSQPANPAPQSLPGTTPGGFAATNIPNLDELVNLGQPATTVPESEVGGNVNINDVISDLFPS